MNINGSTAYVDSSPSIKVRRVLRPDDEYPNIAVLSGSDPNVTDDATTEEYIQWGRCDEVNTTDTKIAILLAKMDQLSYPAANLRTIGGGMLLSYPAEYIEALMAAREKVLEGEKRSGNS